MPVLGTAATQLPQDLEVMDNGMLFAGDRLEHLWFNLVETEAGQEYHLHRVVCLKMLRYLPQEARQDAGLLDTMRSALTGLYNQRLADYDPCSVVAGIFDPPLGVIQCYGVVGLGQEREQATHNANLGMGAIEGVMANFAQSRLEALDIQKAEWLRQAFLDMPFSLVTIGQPDPRQSARGMGREGPAEKSITMTGETAYTMQQNEMLFRALARLEEEFLFLVLASRVAQRDLAVMLEGISSEASVPASRQTGAKSISFGLSFPLAASGSLGQSIGTAYGRNEGQSLSEGLSESEATSHTEGTASTVGHAVTEGTAHTVGTASTSGGSSSSGVSITEGTNRTMGTNQGVTDTVGRADSVGTADTRGSAHTVGTASTSGSFSSSSVGGSAVNTVGTSVTHAESSQVGMAMGGAVGQSASHAEGSAEAMNYNQNVNVDGRVSILGIGGGVSEGVGRGRTATESVGDTHGNNQSANWGVNASQGVNDSRTENQSASSGSSWGSSSGSSHSSTRSSASTTSQAHTDSASHTESSAQAASRGESVSEGVSGSVTRSASQSSFASTTQSVSDTTSHAETDSWSRTNSVSDGTSHGVTRSRSGGRTSGTSVGRAMGVARTMGMSAAVVPSISAAKSYQWYDDKAVQLTAMLRAQEELLRQATLEGAYLTDAYMLCRTERGAAAAEAAIRQAFHGSELPVVTPVQTRRLTAAEQAYIRLHAMAFTPSTREERVAGALEAYKDTTLLLPLQLAAYMAPGLFEEGTAVTTQERTPAFAFVPDMPGEVVLSHLYSTETGRLTSAQLRLSEDRMFHTAFAADTGFGKTVAAERLAVETTKLWKYRTVVFDFGAGWRRLLNADLGEPGRVEVYQVFPGAVVPLRWNPFQIGKRANPEQQMRATCELIRNAGQMGPRQLGFMRRALRALYIKYGVLTSFREVIADDKWGVVQDDEWDVIDTAREEWEQDHQYCPARRANLPLTDLMPFERQALAVHRSKQVDLVMWYERLLALFNSKSIIKPGTPDHTSLEGILLRIESFAEGEMELMYGRGEGSIAIEDLGRLGPADDPWGISILEGGAEMDEFAKAVIFSLAGWRLYHDSVVRRRLSIGAGPQRKLQIFFEEANKVLSGVADIGDQSSTSSASGVTSEIWKAMWRDGRKYGSWLHVIAQTVSELPRGIMSSCNNAFFSQTKEARDRDMIMAHLAFSEKGFTDEDYKRYMSRMPQKLAICKLGYSDDVMHTTPFLCRPVMVSAQEPTDGELLAHHQAMQMTRRVR